MKIYNSYTKKLEEFKPQNPDEVKVYTCGPTVYDYQHIGNFRTFVGSDILIRALKYNDFNVKHIINITDVGHLTGDNLGDADTGEDRLEIAADREGKSAREVADFYTQQFMKDYDRLNILGPKNFPRASEHIQDMIQLIKDLEEKGFTYEISDGVYFDVSKFEGYSKMANQSLEEKEEGVRVDANPQKRNPADFALWKFTPEDKMRWQEWDSPWGRGFPGWHIECSAMAMNELAQTIDVHVGGEDHKMIHHPNEMAQSEAATGKTFANYWMHVAFLKVDGGKMSKSLGNTYLIDDLMAKGFDPLALRYFYMQAHYRTTLNFTWEAMQAAQNSIKKLYSLVEGYKEDPQANLSVEHLNKFEAAINDDLNTPRALGIMWDMLKADISEGEKLKTLEKFDEILGLDIISYIGFEIPKEIRSMAKVRWEYKKQGIWDKADMIRKKIELEGFSIEDLDDDYRIRRK